MTVIFTSAKEVMLSLLFVCLFVYLCVCLLATLPKSFGMDLHMKVGNGPVNKWLNFGGDPDHRLETVFYVVNGNGW